MFIFVGCELPKLSSAFLVPLDFDLLLGDLLALIPYFGFASVYFGTALTVPGLSILLTITNGGVLS